MRFQIFRVVVIGLVSVALAACGGGGGGHKTPPAAASITIVSGNNQTAVAGSVLPTALGVSVKDGSGRALAGTSVSWTVVAGGGSVAPATSSTDGGGLATTHWTLGAALGANRVTATVAGITPVTFDATAVAGATASVTVTSPVEKIYEGDTVQLVATARDAAGNVVQGRSATWSSGNPPFFPLSASGELKTWGHGPVTVTASIDGIAGSLALTVLPIEIQVTVGTREVVLDYTTDRCADNETPDGPARFVRAQDGSLVLFDGRTNVNRGPDFATIARDCSQPSLVKALRPTPDSYENVEMLWSVYREGDHWHALVHNEFHDPIAPTCQPGNPLPGNPCWYNSITYAVSTDGARSFSKPGAPAHTVAPAPYAWVPPAPGVSANGFVEGYFSPSNIVQGKDGYYYSFTMAIPSENWNQMHGLCVFRTRTLGDPASWRAWDGNGFNLRMTSPYVTGETAPICAFLGGFVIPSHLVYDTYLERYLAVATSPGPLDVNGRLTCGILYALSADLVHWSRYGLVVEASMPWCRADPSSPGLLETVNVTYPSIVDHADATVNFERAGRTPYLYYVRFNDGGFDRDVMRVPLTLTRTN